MLIKRHDSDFWRLRSLFFYFNNNQSMSDHWTREIKQISDLQWPESWPERIPLVSILAYSIRPNHFHLFLKELEEGGAAKFMHKISMAYSKFINKKYNESGRLFEGTYKSRLITDEEDFKNLATYIMVKNPFEGYTGGLECACREFETAYAQALDDPFTSLLQYENSKNVSPILDTELLGEIFNEPGSFKEFARERMEHKLDILSDYDF